MNALRQGRHEEARAALLRAVEADPSFAGAWLDLAIASHGAGDPEQAEEFLGILESRFELPAPIAAGVASLRERLQQAQAGDTAGWTWRRTAQVGGGYDTNANAGLAIRDLTLTFVGGSVALPLSEALRPRGDAFATAQLAVEASRRGGAGQLEAAASVRGRSNAGVKGFDTLESQASIAYVGLPATTPARLPGPWRAEAGLQQYRLGGDALLDVLNLKVVHAWSALPCQPQGGIEWEARRFPAADTLDSRLTWLTWSGRCRGEWLGAEGGWNVQVRLGREAAVRPAARPGGNTVHYEATASRHWTWEGATGTRRVEALAQWAGARDSEGYSPLLESNARRSVHRFTAGISYALPLPVSSGFGAGWQATTTLQGFRQSSNLALFRLKGAVIQFSLQRTW